MINEIFFRDDFGVFSILVYCVVYVIFCVVAESGKRRAFPPRSSPSNKKKGKDKNKNTLHPPSNKKDKNKKDKNKEKNKNRDQVLDGGFCFSPPRPRAQVKKGSLERPPSGSFGIPSPTFLSSTRAVLHLTPSKLLPNLSPAVLVSVK